MVIGRISIEYHKCEEQMSSTKEHWEKIYKTKQPDELSWTQAIPSASLAFINELRLPKSARIIDG